jgi:galactose mutarotase-like enzyme
LLAGIGDGDGVARGALVGVLVGEELGRWVAVLGEQAVRRQSATVALSRGLTLPDTTIRGAVKLLGGVWEMEIQPEHGGRIISLRLAGEELLDQGIGVDDPSQAGFVAAGARGWDEMVPCVDASRYPGPGPFEGVELPDHGEAWRLPWTVVDDATLECAGRVLPWRLRRRVELGEHAVRLSYSYRNEGSEPLLAYWCAHPLFRYESDMQVHVGSPVPRPEAETSKKVFLRRGLADSARLEWKSGSAVVIAWDKHVTPYVGVWVCNGDLGGYHHIAIEPATGGGDRPHLAVPPPLLAPGEKLDWWVEVRDARN